MVAQGLPMNVHTHTDTHTKLSLSSSFSRLENADTLVSHSIWYQRRKMKIKNLSKRCGFKVPADYYYYYYIHMYMYTVYIYIYMCVCSFTSFTCKRCQQHHPQSCTARSMLMLYICFEIFSTFSVLRLFFIFFIFHLFIFFFFYCGFYYVVFDQPHGLKAVYYLWLIYRTVQRRSITRSTFFFLFVVIYFFFSPASFSEEEKTTKIWLAFTIRDGKLWRTSG